MDYKKELYKIVKDFLLKKYKISEPSIEFIPTKKDFKGDITIVLFNIIKLIKDKDSQILGQDIGNEIVRESKIVDDFNLVHGFLNLTISDTFYTVSYTHLTLPTILLV